LINFRLIIIQINNIGLKKPPQINYTKTIHCIMRDKKIMDYVIKGKIW